MPMYRANNWLRGMRRLNRQMEYMLGGTRGPIRAEYPLLNAWSGDDGLLLKAEVPGATDESLEITIDGRTLTLRGTREAVAVPEDARRYRAERSHGEFSRSIELPFDVDVENVTADYAGGLLTIELRRLPEEKPRKISVSS